MIRRTARGGSIVGFVAACLVGAVLLVGSVYAVRHSGWFQNGTVATTSNSSHKSSNSSKNGGSTNSGSNSSSKKSSGSQGSNGSSSGTQSPSASGSSNGSGGTAAPQSGGSQGTTNLPTTGPADVVASLFAVGSLTMALTAYIRSRRIA